MVDISNRRQRDCLLQRPDLLKQRIEATSYSNVYQQFSHTSPYARKLKWSWYIGWSKRIHCYLSGSTAAGAGYSNTSSIPYYSSGASSGPFSSTSSATNVSYHNTTSATAYSSAYSSKPRSSNLKTRRSADGATFACWYSRSHSSGSDATNQLPILNTANASPRPGASSPYSSSTTNTYSSERRSSNLQTRSLANSGTSWYSRSHSSGSAVLTAHARHSGLKDKSDECFILRLTHDLFGVGLQVRGDSHLQHAW